MYDIITLGSANVDIFVKTKTKPEISKHHNHTDIAYHLGDKLLIEDLEITTGGGGTNSAVAFSRLGLKTAFIGVLGNDANGSFILKELEKEKVDFLGSIKQRNTGLSIVLPGAHDRTIFAYKGVNNNLLIKDISLSKIKTKWLYVSSMLEQSFQTAEKIIELSKKKNVKVALNLSLYLANKGLNNLAKILSNIDILILNKEEAEALTKKRKIEDILNSLYAHTKAIIVITSGSGEIHACDSVKLYIKRINPINPIDKTGAGDAFASGFVYGIMNGKSIETSLSYGHKEALSVLMHIGAKNNLLKKL